MLKFTKLFAIIALILFQNLAYSQQKSLTGKIRNSEGTPIVGITVALQYGPNQDEVITDASGNYAFSVNIGHYDQLRVRNNMGKELPGIPKVLEYMGLQNFNINKDTIIDITLHKFPRMYGKVKKSDSTTIVDSVYILGKMWNGAEQPPHDNDTSDIAGDYEIFLDTGNVKIWVTAKPNDSVQDFDFQILLKKDTNYNIIFPKPVILSGKVYTHDSIPVSGIWVAVEKGANQWISTTNINGDYSFSLKPDNYRIRVRNTGTKIDKMPKNIEHTVVESILIDSSKTYDIYMPKYSHVYGTVRDTGSNPHQNVIIAGALWSGAEMLPKDNDTSEISGAYSLYLGTGHNRISIMPPLNDSLYGNNNIEFDLADDTLINIELTPSVRVSGYVYSYDSLPVAGITVAFQHGAEQPEAVTNPSGFYTIKLSPDTFTELRVRNTMMQEIPKIPKTLEEVIERPFVLTSTITKDIVLPHYPKIYGNVKDANDIAVSGVAVQSEKWNFGAGQPPYDNCTSDVTGYYEVYIGAGINRIKVTPGGTTYGKFEFIINDSDDVHKDIILANQAQKLTRMQPSVISQGEGGMVEITGINSNFSTGNVTLDFGDSVITDSMEIISPITLKAWIKIGEKAKKGARTIKANSSGTMLVGAELLTITGPTSEKIILDINGKTTADVFIYDGTGTQLKIDSGTVVTFPGADSTITYVAPIIVNDTANPTGASFIQVQRRFSPNGTTFNPPAELSFSYQDQDIIGVLESEIRAFKYNDSTGQVVGEYTVVARDTAANIITIEIPGFSLYRLAENKGITSINKCSILISGKNYPNPFSTSTTISYSVLAENSGKKVKMEIFDINGKKVKTLIDKTQQAGNYEIKWDGRNNNNSALPAGQYILKCTIGNKVLTSKLMLIK